MNWKGLTTKANLVGGAHIGDVDSHICSERLQRFVKSGGYTQRRKLSNQVGGYTTTEMDCQGEGLHTTTKIDFRVGGLHATTEMQPSSDWRAYIQRRKWSSQFDAGEATCNDGRILVAMLSWQTEMRQHDRKTALRSCCKEFNTSVLYSKIPTEADT